MDEADTTADPGLKLLVDGREIPPRDIERTTYLFDLPGGAVDVFIVSRGVVPARQDPANADIRRLGVSVVSLVLRDPRLEVRLQAQDRSLCDGFHEPEPGHRWTDGKARLPWTLLRMFPEPFRLRLRLNPTTLRYPFN
jgi:hypothetical protein